MQSQEIRLPDNFRFDPDKLALYTPDQDGEHPALTFVETPDGLTAGLTFIPDYIQPSDAPLTLNDEITALSTDNSRRLEMELPPRLTARLTLTWEQYSAIESAIGTILSNEKQTVGRCLVAAHVWLGMLRRMLAVAAAGAGEGTPKDSSAKQRGLSPARAEAFDYYIKSTTANGFEKAFQIAARPVHNCTVRRMTLGTLITFRRNLHPGMTRFEAMGRIAYHNVRHWLKLGHIRIDPWSYQINYQQLEKLPEDFYSPDSQRLLRGWLRHCVFRKELILHTDVLRGLCYLVAAHGLAGWTAAALKSHRDQADIPLAVHTTDVLFMRNTRFNASYLYHPALTDIVTHIFKKPTYAHRIIQEP